MALRKVCRVSGARLPFFWELARHPRLRRILFVGLPGAGKSLQMVHLALQQMQAGLKVWANFELVHRPLGLRAGYVGSWDDFQRVCELPGRDKVVVLQEMNLLCSSREWGNLPLEVHKTWAQVRHYGVELLMDAQHENRVDKVMREILDAVVICEPTALPRLIGFPRYLQTWTTPEMAEAARIMLRQVGEPSASELNVRPPGETYGCWVRAWEHECYSTHEILEPWRYQEGTAAYTPPCAWDDEFGWVSQVCEASALPQPA